MLQLEKTIGDYLEYCEYQKNLSPHTLKAYRIDLSQFLQFAQGIEEALHKSNLSRYYVHLHKEYQPKSVRRKSACLKAFCSWLEYEEIIEQNPFSKLKIKYQGPRLLPRTIPIHVIQTLLSAAYDDLKDARTAYQSRSALRNTAVLELLFATGVRVSELCSLGEGDVDLVNMTVRVLGKGSKERVIQIGNPQVLQILKRYQSAHSQAISESGFFFVNRDNRRLSEQSVRFMINKYVDRQGIALHITPHMFRHSFATLLLEEDVDIRYIQQLLGHSSIVTTQIYTHVASSKQRDILTAKHPRNKLAI